MKQLFKKLYVIIPFIVFILIGLYFAWPPSYISIIEIIVLITILSLYIFTKTRFSTLAFTDKFLVYTAIFVLIVLQVHVLLTVINYSLWQTIGFESSLILELKKFLEIILWPIGDFLKFYVNSIRFTNWIEFSFITFLNLSLIYIINIVINALIRLKQSDFVIFRKALFTASSLLLIQSLLSSVIYLLTRQEISLFDIGTNILFVFANIYIVWFVYNYFVKNNSNSKALSDKFFIPSNFWGNFILGSIFCYSILIGNMPSIVTSSITKILLSPQLGNINIIYITPTPTPVNKNAKIFEKLAHYDYAISNGFTEELRSFGFNKNDKFYQWGDYLIYYDKRSTSNSERLIKVNLKNPSYREEFLSFSKENNRTLIDFTVIGSKMIFIEADQAYTQNSLKVYDLETGKTSILMSKTNLEYFEKVGNTVYGFFTSDGSCEYIQSEDKPTDTDIYIIDIEKSTVTKTFSVARSCYSTKFNYVTVSESEIYFYDSKDIITGAVVSPVELKSYNFSTKKTTSLIKTKEGDKKQVDLVYTAKHGTLAILKNTKENYYFEFDIITKKLTHHDGEGPSLEGIMNSLEPEQLKLPAGIFLYKNPVQNND